MYVASVPEQLPDQQLPDFAPAYTIPSFATASIGHKKATYVYLFGSISNSVECSICLIVVLTNVVLRPP